MSKNRFYRARKALDKATRFYKMRNSKRNWKRFRRALDRYSSFFER